MNNSGTVIGKGISIRGEISGAEDFFLEGTIEGNITLDGNRFTVGPNGLARADIITGDLVVFGRVEGSAKASSRVELKQQAWFTGDLTASRLAIEDSASMQGHVALEQPPAPSKKESVSDSGTAAASAYSEAV
jgi:cytoskeletal protein CcmA (bactofilin family)